MKIAVLVSGGVDSSVALALLKEQGHDVTAFYLKIWLEEDVAFLGQCPWEEDLKYVRAVCEQLNVPLQILSLQREYWDLIVSYALSEIKAGRTPNSDMFCNRLIKFGKFYDKINRSFEKVASGHYAQVHRIGAKYLLKRSPDPVKDQTYFLAYMTQEQLARACFPLGIYNKAQVRELARKFDLPNKDRKDSQGICFLGKIRYSDFVKHHLGEQRGDIIDLNSGRILGEHKGYWFYTIGQRQGLGLSGGPWYVVGKDVKKNIIYVAHRNRLPEKSKFTFKVANFNWFLGDRPEKTDLQVKVRHGKVIYNCTIEYLEAESARITLDQPDSGIAPGQFAVFYEGEYCLGGSIIVE